MLKKANIQMSGKTLANNVKKDKFCFECEGMQRGLVWDNDRKDLLIDSMINNYPIPSFYFEKKEDGTYNVLDGKQRINLIFDFISGNYKLSENAQNIIDEEETEIQIWGMGFDELPEWAQDNIKDYSLTIYYFEELTKEEKQELFYRINNGKSLTSTELTRVKAVSLNEFQEIAKHEIINFSTTEKAKIKYVDENIAMQLWAIFYTSEPDFTTKPFRNLIEKTIVTKEQKEEIKNCLDYLLFAYNTLSNDDTEQKKIIKKLTTRTHVISASYLAKLCIEKEISKEEYTKIVCDFFNTKAKKTSNSEEYNSSISSNTARKETLIRRMESIKELVK